MQPKYSKLSLVDENIGMRNANYSTVQPDSSLMPSRIDRKAHLSPYVGLDIQTPKNVEFNAQDSIYESVDKNSIQKHTNSQVMLSDIRKLPTKNNNSKSALNLGIKLKNL
jgi:hypothetical protein